MRKLRNDKVKIAFLLEHRDEYELILDNDVCWIQKIGCWESDKQGKDDIIHLDVWGRDLMILLCSCFGIKADYC